MRKVFSKVTAIVLALTMVAAISPSVPLGSEAKTNDIKLSITIKNKEELRDIVVGDDSVAIEVKFKISGGTKKEQKEAKKIKVYVKDKSVAKLITNKKGGKEVVGLQPGKTKLFVESKVKKGGKPIAKANCNIEVSAELDMMFKYSNLYFVVPEGTSFPVEVAQGGKDAQNSIFDIKTLNFNAKLSDFNFTSDNSAVADFNAAAGKLILKGYGEAEIEADYKKDCDIGDSVTIYVMTQAAYDQAVADGVIDEETENTFEDEPDDPDEPDEPDDSVDPADD